MVGGRLGLNFSKQSWEEIRVFYLNDGPAPDKWRDQACQVKKSNTFCLYLKISTLELYVYSFFFFSSPIKQLYVLQISLQPFRPRHSIVYGVLTRVG